MRTPHRSIVLLLVGCAGLAACGSDDALDPAQPGSAAGASSAAPAPSAADGLSTASSPSATPAGDPGAGGLPLVGMSCGAQDGREPGLLPPGTRVTSASVCRPVAKDVPGRGRSVVEVTRPVAGGLADLVTAYARPDGPPGDGACTQELPPLYDVVVVTADGRRLHVRAPRGTCAKPQPQAVEAYERLAVGPPVERVAGPLG